MIYFRGCTAREKQRNISDATQHLLNKAGVDYKVLDGEKCCGSVLLRTGFVDEARKQIIKNTEIFNDELILTSCAGCYNTFKNDYEGVNAIHISQFLKQLIDEEKINFTKRSIDVTYHDPCHLTRHMKVIEEPREVIERVANLVEMKNSHEDSLCCGAGGGVKSAYPEIADEMAKSRIRQAFETGCETLITACPFCKLNLENDDINVVDLTEFLVEYGGADEEQ